MSVSGPGAVVLDTVCKGGANLLELTNYFTWCRSMRMLRNSGFAVCLRAKTQGSQRNGYKRQFSQYRTRNNRTEFMYNQEPETLKQSKLALVYTRNKGKIKKKLLRFF